MRVLIANYVSRRKIAEDGRKVTRFMQDKVLYAKRGTEAGVGLKKLNLQCQALDCSVVARMMEGEEDGGEIPTWKILPRFWLEQGEGKEGLEMEWQASWGPTCHSRWGERFNAYRAAQTAGRPAEEHTEQVREVSLFGRKALQSAIGCKRRFKRTALGSKLANLGLGRVGDFLRSEEDGPARSAAAAPEGVRRNTRTRTKPRAWFVANAPPREEVGDPQVNFGWAQPYREGRNSLNEKLSIGEYESVVKAIDKVWGRVLSSQTPDEERAPQRPTRKPLRVADFYDILLRAERNGLSKGLAQWMQPATAEQARRAAARVHQLKVRAKAKETLLQILHRKARTAFSRHAKGLCESAECCRCGAALETQKHVFAECPAGEAVWEALDRILKGYDEETIGTDCDARMLGPFGARPARLHALAVHAIWCNRIQASMEREKAMQSAENGENEELGLAETHDVEKRKREALGHFLFMIRETIATDFASGKPKRYKPWQKNGMVTNPNEKKVFRPANLNWDRAFDP